MRTIFWYVWWLAFGQRCQECGRRFWTREVRLQVWNGVQRRVWIGGRRDYGRDLLTN